MDLEIAKAGLGALVALTCFALAGAGVVAHVGSLRDAVPGPVERLALGLLVGAALNAVVLLVWGTVVGATVGALPSIVVCAAAVASATVRFGHRWLGRLDGEQVLTAAVLAVLLAAALEARLGDALQHPDALLDTDPYRHHAATKWLMEGNRLSSWIPLVEGRQPELSMQLQYLIAAVAARLGGFTAWQMWQYGAPVAGALAAVLGGYLLGRLVLGNRPVAGWLCAALLAAVPVHALRTSVGFAETYALPFYTGSLIMFLRFLRSERLADALAWALLLTVAIGCNVTQGVMLAPLLAATLVVVQTVRWFRTRTLRLVPGALLALALFAAVVGVWRASLLPVSLLSALRAVSASVTEEMPGQPPDLAQIWLRHLGLLAIVLAGAGAVVLPAIARRPAAGWLLGRAEPGWCWTLWAFLVAHLLWAAPLMLVVAAGAPTVTSRYHRFVMFAAPAASLLGAAALALGVRFAGQAVQRQWGARPAAIAQATAVGLLLWAVLLRPGAGAPSGHWRPIFDDAEYAAADWLRDHSGPQDMVITNWYTADLVRSRAYRHTALARRLDPRRKALAAEVPSLGLRPLGDMAEIARHAEEWARHGRTVYLLRSRWGPHLDPATGPFERIVEWTPGRYRPAEIWRYRPRGEGPTPGREP